MADIPKVTFHIMGPNEGVADEGYGGLWFKVQSDPPPAGNLIVGLKVRSDGEVHQSGTVMIRAGESHSADLFYRIGGPGRSYKVFLEIEPYEVVSALKFPIHTNEGYVIEKGHRFLEYSVGDLSKIDAYNVDRPERGVWTDR